MRNEFEKIKKEAESLNKLKGNWNIIPGNKLEKMDIPESEFLIDNLIPLTGITILSGKPSAFKSWLLLLISIQISLGKPLFDHFDTKLNKTLYIDEETTLAEIKRRWMMMKDTNTPVYFSSLAGFKVDDKIQRDFLLEICKKEKYKVIVVDSLRDVHTKNENDSKEAQEIIDGFREFTKKGITVLVSHHQRKEFFMSSKDPSQMLRGSDAFLAGIDSLLTVENPKSTEEAAELVITQSKLRQGKKTEPFKISAFEKEGEMNFEYIGKIETEASKLEATKEAVKKLLQDKGELYSGQILEFLIPLYYSNATIRRAIKELKENEIITPRIEGRKTYYYLNSQEINNKLFEHNG